MSSLSKIILGCLLLIALVLSNPTHASAQAHWGGLDVVDYYGICDCSYAVWSWFTPLYLDNPTPYTGALTWYGVSAFTWQNYYIHPGAWGLGYYVPGVQACWTYTVYTCVPVPAIGHIYGSGSSP